MLKNLPGKLIGKTPSYVISKTVTYSTPNPIKSVIKDSAVFLYK